MPKRSRCDVALVLGGSDGVWVEYEEAKALVESVGKSFEVFCCNDMIAAFPGVIDHSVTLHPDKFGQWASERLRSDRPGLRKIWAHRPFPGGTDYTCDWGGSVSLLAVKVAREVGYTHIVLCGCPMTVDGNHFRRKAKWNAAHGFRRGYSRWKCQLWPFVRSMSGWTKEQFGHPTPDWLNDDIPDKHPMKPQPPELKA